MSQYGAVETKDNDNNDTSFEEYNTAFVQERPKSQHERLSDFCTAALPIFIAFVVMAAFCWLGVKAVSPKPIYHQVIPNTPEPVPTIAPTLVPPVGLSSKHARAPISMKPPVAYEAKAECSAHPACEKLELTGDCCPTSNGILLDCCA
eukprot:Nitzschia sp. Nitz4//scaffold147_size54853//22081//22524//NITZ4_006616-RA/size54853-processed-gene-0.13-mRNA-1//1//CDS//3329536690//7622//frame0